MRLKRIGQIIIALCCIIASAIPQATAQMRSNALYEAYIQKYWRLASEQQRKYGIPASITLAQGLLESGAGSSTLARKSNNHFGIKCHNDWDGKKVKHDDDRAGECFRKYKNVKQSYEDHSKFLKRSRYQSLYLLDISDYRGWAYGLKQCGYATDPMYAQKLINVIETYQLHRFDNKRAYRVNNPHNATTQHGLFCVRARNGETPKIIGREFGLSAAKIRKYNDLPKGYIFSNNEIVYLQKKNKKTDKGLETYTIRKGDSMHSISQKFGIQMKKLYRRNHKETDYVPVVGETLRLR